VMPSRGTLIELPGHEPGSGSNSSTAEGFGQICPACFMEMPVAGGCPNCG